MAGERADEWGCDGLRVHAALQAVRESDERPGDDFASSCARPDVPVGHNPSNPETGRTVRVRPGDEILDSSGVVHWSEGCP